MINHVTTEAAEMEALQSTTRSLKEAFAPPDEELQELKAGKRLLSSQDILKTCLSLPLRDCYLFQVITVASEQIRNCYRFSSTLLYVMNEMSSFIFCVVIQIMEKPPN